MIYELATKIGIPEDGAKYVEAALSTILSKKESVDKLFEAQNELMSGGREYERMLEELSEISGVHMYTTGLAFLLYCARSLKYLYDIKGLPEDIFYDSISDITCKYNECMTVYGVHGVFTYLWFGRFFTLKLFALGRLEYGINEFIFDSFTTKNGKHTIKRGERIYDCHIPSRGRFPLNEVMASFKKAYAFFVNTGEIKEGELMPVCCHSYLLYPDNKHLFKEGSNIRNFVELFEIVPESVETKEDNPDFWRIFGKKYEKGLKDYPKDTTLRKSVAEHIEGGGCMGIAYGILYFDGENIVD